jgi:hypothetical protein
MLKILTIFTQLILISFSNSSFASEKIGFSTVTTIEDAEFQEVNESLLEQIEAKGIVVSYTSHANKMLLRTAAQADPAYSTYANAFIHLFCSAELAHKMTKHSPHIISGCPYGIAIYELQSKKNTIYLSYQHSTQDNYQDVLNLLEDITRSVFEEYE